MNNQLINRLLILLFLLMGLSSRVWATCTNSITISSTYIDPVCTAADGSIRLTVRGGTPQYSYRWSNSDTGASIFRLRAGSYTVTVTDAEHHTATAGFKLIASTRLILPVLTAIADTCDGGRGRILVSTGGNGNAPYQYTWSNGMSGAPLNGLMTGTYSVIVTDSNGCIGSARTTVSDIGKAITANGTVSPPLCPGSGGRIVASANQGTSNHYTMVWSNGDVGDTLSNLSAGTYTVTVNGTNNCKATAGFTMPAAPPAISLNAVLTTPRCAGGKGSISISPSGGTGPHYTALWSNGSSGMNDTALSAGTYSVTVTDQNACAVSASYTLSPLTTIHVTGAVSDPVCTTANGSVQLTVSGGTAPYTYLWSNDSTSDRISNLAAGSYTVTTTDAGGCSAVNTFDPSVSWRMMSVAASGSADTCGLGNGKAWATVISTANTGPYTYSWSGGASADTASGLAAGDYTVTITDSYGCSVTAISAVSSFGAPISIHGELSQPLCNSKTGAINITISGGAGSSYTAVWSNGTMGLSNTSIPAGNYTVEVTGQHGCTASATYSLAPVYDLMLSDSLTAPVCAAANGCIRVSVAGGAPPYAYRWSNDSAAASISHLMPGAYAVTVTDSNGCLSTGSYDLVAYSPVVANVTGTNIRCDSSVGGTLLISSLTGAYYPWTISWTGPDSFSSSLNSLYHLSPGTYNVSITDAHGCSTSGSYTLTRSGTFALAATVTNTSCRGGHNGAISLTEVGPYSTPSYLWSGPDGYASTVRSPVNLAAGVYYLTVTEPYGCTAAGTDTVRNGQPISVSYNSTPVRCDSGTGGSLTLTSISNATYPLTVNWTGTDSFSSANTDLYMLNSGMYSLTLMDAAGCFAYGSYQVGSTGSIKANYAAQMISCYGINNGALEYQSMVPYNANAIYRWTGANNFSSNAQSIYGLSIGTYLLEVSGNYGCKAFDTFHITRSFDVGVQNITNSYCPVPGRQIILHPIAGDMSEINGLHCASGISGQVQFIFAGSATYNGMMPGALPPNNVSGDTLTWNIPDFGQLNNDSAFFIYLGIDSAAIYGSEVCVYVKVSPDSGDYNTSNNIDSFCMTVIHAYDPNDKTAYPQGDIDTSVKEIVYTIQFQNTGNASAQNISIMDTLDQNIDPQSFQLLAYSHQNATTLNGNAIHFAFDNINLPDTAVSQTASTGWVQYKVRLRDGLAPGTDILNTAYIYFDLNPVIATHTTVNTISEKAKRSNGSGHLHSGASMQIYPNPAQNFVSVNMGANAGGGRLEMSNAAGMHCASYNITEGSIAIPVGQYASGVYVLHFTAPDGSEDAKELIVEK